MIRVLITGCKGQLGLAMQSVSKDFVDLQCEFVDSQTLDITDLQSCKNKLSSQRWDYCINFAAYTQVDKAEFEKEKAFLVNASGVRNLALACKEVQTVLIHISTDFIFDGNKSTAYLVNDTPNPINVYGASKLRGEEFIESILTDYYIIRTSWVYSEFGNNFKKTMLKLAKSIPQIKVVDDQIGAPTNANDLCFFICKLIQAKPEYGIYHYTGKWIGSWYEFAKRIFEEAQIKVDLIPISTQEFNSVAKRPKYSVLENSIIKSIL
ncbi:dTDP-4-dehydrorhamnose reductase [Myroides sp. LJL119]